MDYGPDYRRQQPFHDATITLGRHIKALPSLRDPDAVLANVRIRHDR